jgi:hypothetical protein
MTGCTRPDGSEQTEETQQSFQSVHIFEGVVSDASCGLTHKTDDPKQCTIACVENGSDYVLLIEGVVHNLRGDAEEFRRFAGEEVAVSASLDGNTLEVVRIGPVAQELLSKAGPAPGATACASPLTKVPPIRRELRGKNGCGIDGQTALLHESAAARVRRLSQPLVHDTTA